MKGTWKGSDQFCVLLRSKLVIAYFPHIVRAKYGFGETGGRHEAATFVHIGSPFCKKRARSECQKTSPGEVTSVGYWWRHCWWTSLAISSDRMGSDWQHFSEGVNTVKWDDFSHHHWRKSEARLKNMNQTFRNLGIFTVWETSFNREESPSVLTGEFFLVDTFMRGHILFSFCLGIIKLPR